MMEEAMAIFRQNGDRFHENYALNIISWTLIFEDQLTVRLTASTRAF